MQMTMKFAVTLAAAVLTLPVSAQTVDRAEVALLGAVKKETVDGDLKGAIEAYRKIAVSNRNNRAVAAKALVRMGQCYEKLGDAESRKAYEQVIREFGDQTDSVATARTRLATLTPKAKLSGATVRRVFDDVTGRKIAVSPNGRWLVHLSRRGQYHLRDISTGQSRQLTHILPGEWLDVHDEAAFTADSRQIAYVVATKEGFEVRLIAVDGSGERTVFRNSRRVQLSGWFPDSARILVMTALGAGPNGLHTVSIAGGSTTLVKRGEESLDMASLSADGKLVVYNWAMKPPDEWSIRILNLDDGTDVAISEHSSRNWAPRFAPQNQGIVFRSSRRGTGELWYQPLSQGKPAGPPELIPANTGSLLEPAGMTNDGTLYFRAQTRLLDSYLGEFDAGTGKWVSPPRKLSPRSTGQTGSPAFTADGQWVSYTRTQKAGWAPLTLVLHSISTNEEREIPTDLGWVEWHWWFPDGKSLLIQGKEFSGGQRYGIYRFDLSSRSSKLLRLQSRGWATRPAIDSDGKTVYLPLRNVIAWNIETGVERDLVRGDQLSNVSLSPDGRSLATVRSEGETRVLETIGTDGRGRRELYRSKVQPGGIGGIGTPTWLRDGRSIMFSTGTGTGWWPAGRRQIPAEGGTPRDVGLGASNTEIDGKQIAWPVWHPDGRHVAVDAGDLREECYALENVLPAARAGR